MANIKFELNSRVSSFLAIALLLSLSLAVAWYSITTAAEILKNAPESSAFNMEKRVENENLKK